MLHAQLSTIMETGRLNFVVVSRFSIRLKIKHLSYKDYDELRDSIEDYTDCDAICNLEIGQSYNIQGDRNCTIIRVS